MIPDYNGKISLPNNIKEYTAPKDGYIVSSIFRSEETITYYISVNINGIPVAFAGGGDGILTYVNNTCCVPVAKNDVIIWYYENESCCGSKDNYFIPVK